MKKTISFIALGLLLLVGSVGFAQTNGLSIHVGGSMPVGGFGKTDNAFSSSGSNFLGNNSGHAGAGMGLNIGLKAQYGIPLPILGSLKLMATADLMYNGMKSEASDAINNVGDMVGGTINELKNFDPSAPAFYNVPLMVGANFTFIDILVFKLFVEAGVGVNFRFISDMERTVNLGSTLGEVGFKTDFDTKSTFAFQVGVGVCLFKRVSLSFNYYNLGKSEITGTADFVSNLGSLPENVKDRFTSFSNGETGNSMFLLRLGFHF